MLEGTAVSREQVVIGASVRGDGTGAEIAIVSSVSTGGTSSLRSKPGLTVSSERFAAPGVDSR